MTLVFYKRAIMVHAVSLGSLSMHADGHHPIKLDICVSGAEDQVSVRQKAERSRLDRDYQA